MVGYFKNKHLSLKENQKNIKCFVYLKFTLSFNFLDIQFPLQYVPIISNSMVNFLVCNFLSIFSSFFEYTSKSKLWHIQYVGILKEFDKYCQMAIWGRFYQLLIQALILDIFILKDACQFNRYK